MKMASGVSVQNISSGVLPRISAGVRRAGPAPVADREINQQDRHQQADAAADADQEDEQLIHVPGRGRSVLREPDDLGEHGTPRDLRQRGRTQFLPGPAPVRFVATSFQLVGEAGRQAGSLSLRRVRLVATSSSLSERQADKLEALATSRIGQIQRMHLLRFFRARRRSAHTRRARNPQAQDGQAPPARTMFITAASVRPSIGS